MTKMPPIADVFREHAANEARIAELVGRNKALRQEIALSLRECPPGVTVGNRLYQLVGGSLTITEKPLDVSELDDPNDDGEPADTDADEPPVNLTGPDDDHAPLTGASQAMAEYLSDLDRAKGSHGYARLAAFSLDASKPNGGLPRNDYGFPVVNDEPARAFPA